MSKPISIVIITNDDSITLRNSLPEIFAQQYDAAFEVIVVRETRTGEMKDLLEPLLERYPNLHTTYLPDKPQYVTNEEVEILLGVKAAQYEDIIIIPPSFMPTNDNWLSESSIIISDSETGIAETRPILLATAHYDNAGFFRKRRNKKAVAKLLKPWCKSNSIRRKSLQVSKEDRGMFTIAFSRQAYLDDIRLRDIIYKHTLI